jgi:hypothetical protein
MSCKGEGYPPVEEQLELHLWVLAVMLFSELWLSMLGLATLYYKM